MNNELFELVLSAIDLFILVDSGEVSKEDLKITFDCIFATSDGEYKNVAEKLKEVLSKG